MFACSCSFSRRCDRLELHLHALVPCAPLVLQSCKGTQSFTISCDTIFYYKLWHLHSQFSGGSGVQTGSLIMNRAEGLLLSSIKPCTVTEGNQFGSRSQILCISFIRSGHQRADRQVRPKDLWTQLKLYHKEIKFMWFTFQKVTFGGLYLLLFCNLMQTMWTFETLLTVNQLK